MKHYKRIIAAMTAAAVALSAFSLTALARDITIGYKNSSENPNITLTLSDDTYEYGYYSYSLEENSNCAVITGYSGNDSVVNIPQTLGGNPVIGIDNGAFYENKNIVRVNVPDGVQFIGTLDEGSDGTFDYCDSLRYISLPDSVTLIGNQAFEGSGLRSISIPDGAEIGYGAFFECKDLTSVKLPEGLVSVPDSCFYNCESLRTIVLPSTVDMIGSSAFDNCKSLRSVVFPDTFSMGEAYEQFSNNSSLDNYSGQFANCISLSNIVFPDSLKIVTPGMFENSGLRTIDLGDGVEVISNNAFANCYLNGLYLPDSLKEPDDSNYNCLSGFRVADKISMPSWGPDHIEWCDNAKEVEVRGVCTIRPMSQAETGYDYSTEVTIADGVSGVDLSGYYTDSTYRMVLSDSVTSITASNNDIGNDNNKGIQELVIGSGLINIENNALDYLPYLQKINVNGAGKFSSYKGALFLADGSALVKVPRSYQCDNDDNIFVIPYGTKKICENALGSDDGYSLTVEIPATVTDIAEDSLHVSGIRGTAGSAAEEYAKKNGISFTDINAGTDSDKHSYDVTVNSKQTVLRDNTNFTQPTFSGKYGDVTGTLVYTDEYGSVMTYEGVTAMLANFRMGTYKIGYRFTPDGNNGYGGTTTGSISITIAGSVVYAPKASAAADSGSVKLSWEPVSNAISYEIDKINGNTAYKVGETSQTSYIYTDVEENQTYSFVVRAFDGDSLSAYSSDNVVTVTVPSREKQALTADDFTFAPPEDLVFDGSVKYAGITANKTGISASDITIKYTDSVGMPISEPVSAGVYTVSIDVAETGGYLAASGISSKQWTFTIEKAAAPDMADICDSVIWNGSGTRMIALDLPADSGGIIDQSVEIQDDEDIISDTVTINDSWLEYTLNEPDGNTNSSAVITVTLETLNYDPITFSIIITTHPRGTIQTDIIIKEL